MDIPSVHLWKNWLDTFARELLREKSKQYETEQVSVAVASRHELRILLSGLSATGNKSFLIMVKEYGKQGWTPMLQVHNVNDDTFLAYDAKKIEYYRIPHSQVEFMKLNKSFGRFISKKLYHLRG
jgi:hypothetical protein